MNQYKRLAANTIIFAIGSFGSKILTLFLTKLYTANINPADISTKELLEQTANFLIPIVTFSITDAILRYGLTRNYDKGKIFTSSYLVLGLGVCVMLALSPLMRLLPYTSGYLWLLMLYVFMSSLRSIHSQFVRARGMVTLFAFDGILATITLFIFNVIFIALLNMGITGFLLSVICSDFLSAVFLWWIADLRKYLHRKYISPKMTRLMIRFSIPLIPTTLLWLVTGFSDRLFLRYMDGPPNLVGDTAAGIYGIASKLPNLISTVSTVFYQAWNMSAILENDSANRGHFYKQVFSAYESFLVIASSVLIVFVRPFSDLLISTSTYTEYADAYRYTPILIISVFMMCLNQFFSSIYAASQHTSHSFWTSLVAAIVNLILNWLLIGALGISGAGFATFVSYLVSYLIRVVDTKRYVPFYIDHTRFVLNLILMFAMTFVTIQTPPAWHVIDGVLLTFTVLYNFKDLVSTVRRVLKRG